MYPGCSFYVTTSEFNKADIQLQKQQKVGEVNNVSEEVVHIKHDRYQYLSGEQLNNYNSSVISAYRKLNPTIRNNWQNTRQ